MQWRPVIVTRPDPHAGDWVNTSTTFDGGPAGVVSRAPTRELAEALGREAARNDRAEHVVFGEDGGELHRTTYTD
jgi:Uncharacterized protein conserved in bacteria (DUF2188)